jgi:hypothetical protein
MKLKTILIVLVALFVIVNSALAMSSANYALDWYVLLTGGGGGATASANYTANFTVGQSAIGNVTSANSTVGLGYWYDVETVRVIYLPLVMGDQ